ncbi:hypothetical protein HOK68_03085 [Candidatus Woesearchaeota archaeon]|jgi:uncharacterized membrane protein (UPF0127 family)|nr:hypothetical protein [Candidatus Woesearchaeota archaeon]MBT4387569.1 hypothetical protein [Candidatus Woesearchaeota archaeon]MBT4595411.1 hypothetical protein [Candidatus Woesearchaeota archaeon]MBT5741184.1 hypothetical protein [Candidatus Woesearchaeota archaeon]MBT6505738.1 hypothetical protein [Candidatus Woesearchaeota archaeon]
MKIKLNNQTIICKNSKNVLQNAIGLMFQINPRPILFNNIKTYDLVHMFFVFYKINIIFLDKENKIIEQKILYPFISFKKIPKNTNKIIEIPLYKKYRQFKKIKSIKYF